MTDNIDATVAELRRLDADFDEWRELYERFGQAHQFSAKEAARSARITAWLSDGPALLDELDRLRAENVELKRAVELWRRQACRDLIAELEKPK